MGNIEQFDNIANTYDTAERVNIANLSSSAIEKSLGNTKYKTALDFGCGSGLVGLNLINDFEKVYFLDTSLNMLKVVDEKIKKLGLDNAETIYLNLEEDNNMDLDIKFDCVFMCQVLLHIKDYKPVLEKLKNLLNPNGTLVVVDFDKNHSINSEFVHNGFIQTDLCEELKSLGFNKVNSENFHTGENIFMNQSATMFVLKAEL